MMTQGAPPIVTRGVETPKLEPLMVTTKPPELGEQWNLPA